MTETESQTDSNDPSLYLSQEEEQRKLIFKLKRELINAEWNDIEKVGSVILEKIDERKKPQVLVDLSALEHMGSSMVALLVNIWKRVDSKQGAAAFLSTHEGINQVLRIAGLTKVWKICDTREEALDALGGTTEKTGRNLAKFLVSVSLICTTLSGACLAMILTENHLIGEEIEPKIQIAAGAVAGLLGLWAFGTSRRLTRILGFISAVGGIGLTVQAFIK